MSKIPTHLFKPQRGTIEAFLFANSHAGIEPTLYYSINILLEPFDSGMPWEPQPLETDFRLDFLELSTRDWRTLDGRAFTLSHEQSDCSIYLGTTHNPVEVHLLDFTLIGPTTFNIHAKLLCNFEQGAIGENAEITVDVDLDYQGLVVNCGEDIRLDLSKPDEVRAYLSSFVDLDAYGPDVQLSKDLRARPTGPILVLLPAG